MREERGEEGILCGRWRGLFRVRDEERPEELRRYCEVITTSVT